MGSFDFREDLSDKQQNSKTASSSQKFWDLVSNKETIKLSKRCIYLGVYLDDNFFSPLI